MDGRAAPFHIMASLEGGGDSYVRLDQTPWNRVPRNGNSA